MTTLLVQFHCQFRGRRYIELRVRPGDTAELLARRAVTAAVGFFNSKWPGVTLNEVSVCGITNGQRVLDAWGIVDERPFAPVPPHGVTNA